MLVRQVAPLLLFSIILCLVYLKCNTVERKCDNLLDYGRWSSQYDSSDSSLLWQPYDSVIQLYDKPLVSKCLNNRTLYFVGDSTVRQVFWAVAAKHDRDEAGQKSAEVGKHEDFVYRHENVSLSFIWDPYLNSSQVKDLFASPNTLHPSNATEPGSKSPIAGIIISTGLWHARYSGAEFSNNHRQALHVAAYYTPKSSLRSHDTVPNAYLAMTPSVILPPPVLNHNWLNPERATTLSPERLANITENLLAIQKTFDLEVAWSARAMTVNNSAAIMSGGLHVTREIAAYQAEVILNRVCNNMLFSGSKRASSSPCVRQAPTTIFIKESLGLVPLFVVAFYLATYESDHRSHGQCLPAVLILAATICYCWLTDRTILFDKGNKLVDVRLFCLCTAAVLSLSLARLKCIPPVRRAVLPQSKLSSSYQHDKVVFLPREITEEWKGWMQIVILNYHYFGMSRTLPIYQVVRVLVASYLFLTGYGHATYFLNTQDFSLQRIFKVVLRLNLLTCLLATAMSNNHEFYYFPSLATVWFAITYVVFWRREGQKVSANQMCMRILVMLGFCYAVIRNEHLVKLAFDGLQRAHGPKIDSKEFLFRFRLDLLVPFVGMFIAVLEDQSFHRSARVWRADRLGMHSSGIKIVRLAFSVVCIISYACIARRFNKKQDYNMWHCVLSLFPIAAYTNLRKLLWDEYNTFAPILTSIGSMSLELFVLQYHIWLAADTKALLRLGLLDIPGTNLGTTVKGSWAYWTETLIVTAMFFYVSNYCSWATNVLVQWFCNPEKDGRGRKRKVIPFRMATIVCWLWMVNCLTPTEHGL